MTWKTKMLPRLEFVGDALVPCKADKAPIELAWQKRGYSADAVGKLGDKVRAVGINPKRCDLICIDCDTAEAYDLIQAEGLPLPPTWHIGRSNNPDRAKFIYRVTQAQKDHMPTDAGKWSKNGLEVFWNSQQFIVAGEHPSGGFYTWENGPEALAQLPDEWIKFLPKRKLANAGREDVREIDLQSLLTREHQRLVDSGLGVEGGRNHALFALASDAYSVEAEAHRRQSIDVRVVGTADSLIEEALSRTDCTGISKSEIDATLRSAKEGRSLTRGFEDKWAYAIGKSAQQVRQTQVDAKPACKYMAIASLLPSGWQEKENGNASKRPLDCGALMVQFEQFLGDRMRYNLLGYEVEIDGQPLTDPERTRFLGAVQNRGYTVTDATLCEALLANSSQNSYHPVREYLESLGGSDLDSMALCSLLLGQDDMLQNVMLQRFLVGAVARAMNPGSKMDYVCILHGKQGVGKSEFWKYLFGPSFYQSYRSDKNDKDSYLALHGSWGIELAEFDNMSNRDASSLKNFISTATDYIRRPYARRHEHLPRPSVFPGTCNTDTFLKDHTGERRYWVIDVPGEIDIQQVIRIRDQVWAAVFNDWKRGDLPFLPRDLAELNESRNVEFREQSPLYDQIKRLTDSISGGWIEKSIVHEQMAKSGVVPLGVVAKEIKSAMLDVGWTEDRARRGKARGPRYWRRNEGLSAIEVDNIRLVASNRLIEEDRIMD